jgi:hypothetical protein
MGPSALRIAQLAPALTAIGHTVVDDGNLMVPQRETLPSGHSELSAITVVCQTLAAHTAEVVARG